MNLLVSIIIPVWNAERWLQATLESALAQTWPRTEILVVDDGSTDGSVALARRFEGARLRVIACAHRGASATRNEGLQHAQGDYLQYLDADDLLAPDKLAVQIRLLLDSPPRRVASCAWRSFTHTPADSRVVPNPLFRDLEPIAFLVAAASEGAMMHPGAWLVPRALADGAGPWDPAPSPNDDGEYFARVVLASSGIRFAADTLSYYRVAPGTLSRQWDERACRSRFHTAERIAAHMLAAEDAPRVRQACADLYQRCIYRMYPTVPDLVQEAERRVRALGGSRYPAKGGPAATLLTRLIGWRAVARLRAALRGGPRRAGA